MRHTGKTLVSVGRGSPQDHTSHTSLRMWEVCKSHEVGEKCSEPTSLHMNCLELSVVLKVLKHFTPLLKDKRLAVRTDNSGVYKSPRWCSLSSAAGNSRKPPAVVTISTSTLIVTQTDACKCCKIKAVCCFRLDTLVKRDFPRRLTAEWSETKLCVN